MMNFRILTVLGVFLIASSTRAGAQGKRPVAPRGDILDLRIAPPACCVVTTIDLVKGIVSGRETATGYTFKFTVIPGTMSAQDSTHIIHGINIGQKVWASLQGKGVKVIYDKPMCCWIIEESDH
jgi:hypothetical protein